MRLLNKKMTKCLNGHGRKILSNSIFSRSYNNFGILIVPTSRASSSLSFRTLKAPQRFGGRPQNECKCR